MSSNSEARTAMIREESGCLPFHEIPHTSELFTAFVEGFSRVSSYFPHAPTERGILEAARTVQIDPAMRPAVVEVLREQNLGFGAGEDVVRNLDRLLRGAVAIVTGQQVGLFSGPLYGLLKALSAVRVAEQITGRGVDAVPVFWLATEDHDLAEVDHSFWNARSRLTRYELPPHALEGDRRVGEITLGKAIESIVAEAVPTLDGPFAAEVARALGESYTARDTYGSSFGKLMTRLLAGRGLILLDPLNSRLHQLASPVFRRALHDAGPLEEALTARSERLEREGFHAQVRISPASTLLFFNLDGRRYPVRRREGKFIAGDTEFRLDELHAAIESAPEAITPGVLLRPVVQDALLPTAAYLAGPAEVAYMAQAQVLYERILGRSPAVLPRLSVTLVEPALARILSKYDLDMRDVLEGPQHVRSRMERKAIPDPLAQRFESDEQELRRLLESYADPIEKLDRTLRGALENVKEKMLHQFSKLKEKVGRAENFRTGVLDDHERILFDSLYPRGELQERSLCALPLIAAHGPELLDELTRLSSAPASSDPRSCAYQHRLLFL
ncbi:MAG TPA: bacillithiol biosynthesis cysteine-adding enzyme BshC [Candidatus Cybelea sp.]|nr:bacillithiol biosynthesis cysteine-adding enzyme BshC [Candidatus Cybelea sp.]